MAAFEVEISKDESSSAVVGNFSNGCLRTDQCAPDVRFAVLESKTADVRGRKKRSLVAETDNMTYIGHSTGMYAPSDTSQCKYMVGVLNRKESKMRLLNCQMFNLRPEALVNEKEEEEEKKDETDSAAKKNLRQKNDDLTSAFGSSRKKKAMASRIKNQLKGEVLEEAVGSAVKQVIKQQPDMISKFSAPATNEAATNIPPHNVDAKTPQEVYKLEDIISAEELLALHTPAKTLAAMDGKTLGVWRKEGKYPLYILEKLSVLPIHEESRLHKCCCLLYLHYMIKLFQMKSQHLKGKSFFTDRLLSMAGFFTDRLLSMAGFFTDRLLSMADPFEEADMPDAVMKKLYHNFCVMTGKIRSMPARLKDKLLSYLMVLCLILDEFKLDTIDLQKDLKMGERKMATFLQALGCQVKSQKTRDEETGLAGRCCVATIPIPLTFPDLKRKGKAKARN